MPVLARSPLAEGRWGSGQWLRSERRLCEMLGVSRITVRRALGALVQDGLLQPDPGRGWVVTGGPLIEPPDVSLSFTMAPERGLEPKAIVLVHKRGRIAYRADRYRFRTRLNVRPI